MRVLFLATIIAIIFLCKCVVVENGQEINCTITPDELNSMLSSRTEKKEYIELRKKLIQRNIELPSKIEFERFGLKWVGYNTVFFPDVFDPFGNYTSKRFFPIIKDQTVFLDMGCGTGYYAVKSLIDGAKHAVAIDINPFARLNAIENAQLYHVEDKLFAIESDMYNNLPLNYSNGIDVIFWNMPWIYVSDDSIYNNNSDTIRSSLYYSVFDYNSLFLERYLNESRQWLKQDGQLYLEYSSTIGNSDEYLQYLCDKYHWNRELYENLIEHPVNVKIWKLTKQSYN